MMFLYTNYVVSPEQRYQNGYYFIYLILGSAIVNLIVLFSVIVIQIKTAIRRYCIKRRLRKAMKQKVVAMLVSNQFKNSLKLSGSATDLTKKEKVESCVAKEASKSSGNIKENKNCGDNSSSSSFDSNEDSNGPSSAQVYLFSDPDFQTEYQLFRKQQNLTNLNIATDD